MAALLIDGPETAAKSVLLAHGAGAPMDSPFMQRVAEGVAGSGVRVIRFEFPYMRRRRETGKGGAPDPERLLMRSFRDKIDQLGGGSRLVIGGKSFDGRIASMVADEATVLGLVCFGYPFHPSGKPEKTRTRHLENLRTPTLILQGTRDSLGGPEEVGGYKHRPRSGLSGSKMEITRSSRAYAAAAPKPTMSARPSRSWLTS
jgi:uncharacterized protein